MILDLVQSSLWPSIASSKSWSMRWRTQAKIILRRRRRLQVQRRKGRVDLATRRWPELRAWSLSMA